MRGQVISSSYGIKEYKKELQALSQSILNLDRLYYEAPTAKLHKKELIC